jgi:predicted acylesterase/phospholipase RssA
VELQAAEDVKYEIVTGISAGTINSVALSQFKIGDEKAASQFLLDRWTSIKVYFIVFEV